MRSGLAPALGQRQRWIALVVLCLGTLMIVLDTTIVNVALPSIREDLHFPETSLVWVVNAYLLTFGGFLLLGGRLGDLYGHRRMFVAGLVLFTVASMVCGLANARATLVAARAVQGLGGAVVDAIALSLIMNLFDDGPGRARAMGVYGFVCAAGGSIGVLLGGLLTQAFSWHWIFLVNVPIGIVVVVLAMTTLPRSRRSKMRPRLDLAGASAVTLALLCAVYAVVDGNQSGWRSFQTIGLLGLAVALVAAFVIVETRAATPLMPLRLLRIRQVVAANVVGVLWAAALFAWFFLSALYLQLVLGYDPRQVGYAFVPSNLIMAAFSIGISAKLVVRHGLRGPLVAGMLCAAVGLGLFARAPVDGVFWSDVLPGMLLFGVGGGMAFNPLMLAAMSGVDASDSGIASGIVNTSFMLGGALGLAILASVAAAHTDAVRAGGTGALQALVAGYHLAFAVGAVSASAAAVIAWLAIDGRPSDEPPSPTHE